MQELMQKLLERGVNEKVFSGAVAACGDAHQLFGVAWAGSLWYDGPAVNRETRYDMASVSKILGPTMIALRAIEKGDLTLYDTLGEFFPEAPEEKKPITVLQLMTHTSGIAPELRMDKFLTDPALVLPTILQHPLEFPIGQGPHYSCIGYITLAKMLEKLYGLNLKDLAKREVFDPLGMRHTCYCPEGGNIAATEIDPATGKAIIGVVHDENARLQGGISGNAGVFSDIDDMILFARMLARGGDGFLSPATLTKAIHNYTPGCDVHRGLGFHLAGTPENYIGDLFPACSFGHTGFTGTSFVVDPTTGFFVIMLNNRVHPTRNNNKNGPFRRKFHNALYAEFSRRNPDR